MTPRQVREVYDRLRAFGAWADWESQSVCIDRDTAIPHDLRVAVGAAHGALYRLLRKDPVEIGYARGPSRFHRIVRRGESHFESLCGAWPVTSLKRVVRALPPWTPASTKQDRLCGWCLRRMVDRELRRVEEEIGRREQERAP